MKLVEMQVSDFIEILGSNEPAPGGGSAAALSAAMGISLTKMVTELTIGKKKYLEFEDEMKKYQSAATSLQQKLLIAIDADTEAFNVVSAVFSMPKETAADKQKRKEAMQQALEGAAKSPFEMMKLMVEALELTAKAVGKSNVNAASDLGVAALNLKAGLQGAWLNVLINLSGIKNEEFVESYSKQGKALVITGSKLADKIYEDILKIV